jgi:hypothetical protein
VDGSCYTARGQSTLPRDPAYFLRTICAVHESGSGTSRHCAATQQFGRLWSEADINHRAGFPRSAVQDHSRSVPPAWRSRYLESVADQLMPPTPIDDESVRARFRNFPRGVKRRARGLFEKETRVSFRATVVSSCPQRGNPPCPLNPRFAQSVSRTRSCSTRSVTLPVTIAPHTAASRGGDHLRHLRHQ